MRSLEVERCPGRGLAESARSLSDLLFDSPEDWQHLPLLRGRLADGSWRKWTRAGVQQAVLRLAAWLEAEGIRPGDRVGILGHNSPEWFMADFAILRLGAVTVPAYFTDPEEAVQHVFEDAGCSMVFVEPGKQQQKLAGWLKVPFLPFRGEGTSIASVVDDSAWDGKLSVARPVRDDLATLIYTSGTTSRPKGVMLSHGNLLSDVAAGLGAVPIWSHDLFLSFLPVSHAFERTVGHFLPVASGAEIAYAEDVTTLMRDMMEVRPTTMISVPRLYEKIYDGVQAQLMQGPAIKRKLFALAQRLGEERFLLRREGRDLAGTKALLWKVMDRLVNAKLREKLGGRLRSFVSGGAALHPEIARFLLAADITVLPGYGLTEASPVLTVNRAAYIKPESIGPALPGVELKLAEDGELLARGPMVMQGYWNKPDETAAAIGAEGWLHTGDIAVIDNDGFVRIVDRKKEIMVLSNGENVPPAVVEQHLVQDPTILQAMVIAEDRPYVAALIVPASAGLASAWTADMKRPLPVNWRSDETVHMWMQSRLRWDEHDLPSYMQIRNFRFVNEEWTQADGLLTPTLKLKRRMIAARYAAEIEELYPPDKNGNGD
ncbi:MAG TPA: long-chain fatty acid--CoA ligase [Mariprofundaceae bacterium]|nr:long-chain fatty acid--CoA ligase [Mariprofundaceae bacterium]